MWIGPNPDRLDQFSPSGIKKVGSDSEASVLRQISKLSTHMQ